MRRQDVREADRRDRSRHPLRALVVVCSRHHGNTEKVAGAMGGVLGARVRRPQEIDCAELERADLVGFGSGIDSDMHYKALIDLVDDLPPADGKRAFIFSTCGAPVRVTGEDYLAEYSRRSHAALRTRLVSRGYTIVGEFSCPGFNTNSFLRLFGGLNRGRPGAEDLRHAEEFARTMKGESECARDLDTP